METMATSDMDQEALVCTEDFEGFIKPKQFIRQELSSFDVETHIDDNGADAVIHFYAKSECAFPVGFANVLDATAQDYFKATFPRIKAAYTPEMQSWWMQLNSFPVLDLQTYIDEFYKRLDAEFKAVPET